jgi:hypothetical protein
MDTFSDSANFCAYGLQVQGAIALRLGITDHLWVQVVQLCISL